MTSPDVAEYLKIVLAEDRSVSDRIDALDELEDQLHSQEVVTTLIDFSKKQDSSELREKVIEVLSHVDITRITDRDGFIQFFMTIAAFDTQEECRWIANTKLSEIGPVVPEIERFLLENVRSEFSRRIQFLNLEALARMPKLQNPTIQGVLEFAEHAPLFLRPYLRKIFSGLDQQNAEKGLVMFLRPDEIPEMKNEIVNILSGFSRFSEASLQKIIQFLPREPDEAIREKAAEVVANNIQKNPDLFQFILQHLKKNPDDLGLVELLKNKIFAEPILTELLVKMFPEIPSSALKMRILTLLENSGTIDLYAAALLDSNANVRRVAGRIAGLWIQREPEKVSAALIIAMSKEEDRVLRLRMAESMLKLEKVSKALEKFLIQHMITETDIKVLQTIVKLVAKISVTDENYADILKAYLRVIQEPFFEKSEKKFVQEKLESFAYRDAPELKIAIKTLMQRSTDMDEVARLYKTLKLIEPDPKDHADLIHELFYRYVHFFPKEPLNLWLSDIKNLSSGNENFRKELPRIAQITKANWLIQDADKDDLKNSLRATVMETLRGPYNQTHIVAANPDAMRKSWESMQVSLIKDAYEKKALKKSDLVFFYKRCLQVFDENQLLDLLTMIMNKENIVTDEIVNDSMKFLTAYAYGIDSRMNKDAAYNVSKLMEEKGDKTPGYRNSVLSTYTTTNYKIFFQMGSFSRLSTYEKNWEQTNWFIDHDHTWQVAPLFKKMRTPEDLENLLLDFPDPAQLFHQSVPFLELYGLYRENKWTEQNVKTLGKLIQKLSEKKNPLWNDFLDRAVSVFTRGWMNFHSDKKQAQALPALADVAAKAFYFQAKNWFHHPQSISEIQPLAPMIHMNLDAFENRWKTNDSVLEAVWKNYEWVIKTAKDSKSPWRDRKNPEDLQMYQGLKDAQQLVDFVLNTTWPTQVVAKEKWKKLLAAFEPFKMQPWLAKALEKLPDEKQNEMIEAVGL